MYERVIPLTSKERRSTDAHYISKEWRIPIAHAIMSGTRERRSFECRSLTVRLCVVKIRG